MVPRDGSDISILVLGDEGVGKSSLVSTFVSRHFSELVPGILTRVRIPPDPSLFNCTCTIIDTQEGNVALSKALAITEMKPTRLGSIQSSSVDTMSSAGRSQDMPKLAEEQIRTSNDTLEQTHVELRPAIMTHTQSTKRHSTGFTLAPGSPFRNVHGIILVYDLDRKETFHRLENLWLPLIETYYNGEIPVIIAGNKVDLMHQSPFVASSSDNPHSKLSQQHEIIALLQRFKFVRQCIKCSAKNLFNVDEVFRKSQHSILYPINPLYNLNTGRLTDRCVRALTRIFRIYDRDRDGLLSDFELSLFQHEIWGVALMERDFSGWKKVVAEHDSLFKRADDGSIESANNEDVLLNGKFTVNGFLTIFDVFICQNKLDVPWKVLRTLGYDDEVTLSNPPSLSNPRDDYVAIDRSKWVLNHSELEFLTHLFHQFDSDGNWVLSEENIQSIFSVLSIPLPPWSERGKTLFQECFSIPRMETGSISPSSSVVAVRFDPAIEVSPASRSSSQASHSSSPSILSASGLTITSSPLPSVDVSKGAEPLYIHGQVSKPLTYLSWMNHWHMLCTVSPTVCRSELYHLGYIFEKSPMMKGKESFCPSTDSINAAAVSNVTAPDAIKPSIFARALVIGTKDSGASALTHKIHGTRGISDSSLSSSWIFPETSCSVSNIMWPRSNGDAGENLGETIVHLIITEVRIGADASDVGSADQKEKLAILLQEKVYDMVILVFDASDDSSFSIVREFESNVLSHETSRFFVATCSRTNETIQLTSAMEHCKFMDLEPPFILHLDSKPQNDSALIEHILCCAQHHQKDGSAFRSIPHGDRKRRKAEKRRKFLWLGGLVTAGITVVIGFRFTRKRKICLEKGWLKSLFHSLIRTRT